MSAVETLREAAKTLRERAEAATPGPWDFSISEDRAWALTAAGEAIVSRSAVDEDATLIATLHPGVALALADWLDDVADSYAIAKHGFWSVRALRVAEAVLGGGETHKSTTNKEKNNG